MLADDAVERGVLGVSRVMHWLGSNHAEEYRASLGPPMPKD